MPVEVTNSLRPFCRSHSAMQQHWRMPCIADDHLDLGQRVAVLGEYDCGLANAPQ
jgi:hypothetical protein